MAWDLKPLTTRRVLLIGRLFSDWLLETDVPVVIVYRPTKLETELGSMLDAVASMKSGRSPTSSSPLSSLPLPLWSSEYPVLSSFSDTLWYLYQLVSPKRSATFMSILGKLSTTFRVQTSAVPETLKDTIGVARFSSRSASAAGRSNDPLKSIKHWL